MNGLNIKTTNSQLFISLDKKYFDENYLLRMMERLRLE
jgi:hypothetical protein